MRGRRQIPEGNLCLCLPLLVEVGEAFERQPAILELLVLQSEFETRIGCQRAASAQNDFAFGRKPGSGRAIKPASRHIDHRRFVQADRVSPGRHFNLNAVRPEILHEKCRLGHRLAFRVGVQEGLPCALHGVSRQIEIKHVSAQRLAAGNDPPVLETIRALQDQRQRQVGERPRFPVSRNCRQVNGLTGPVDAALGCCIDINTAGCGASADATVCQIEARTGQIEKGEIVLAMAHDQRRRRQTGKPARQTGFKGRASVAVTCRFAQNLVVAGNECQRSARKRLCVRQGPQEHRQAILAGIGAQPGVGHDKPLRCLRVPALRFVTGGNSGKYVDTCAPLRQHLIDGDTGGHFAVWIDRNLDTALPDRFANIGAQPFNRIAIELCQEFRIDQHIRQGALADAVKPQIG